MVPCGGGGALERKEGRKGGCHGKSDSHNCHMGFSSLDMWAQV